MVVVEGVPQAVADQAVLQLRVTQAQAGARLGQHVGRQTHALLAAGQDQVGFAQSDGLGGQVHGLQARAAQLVDGYRRHLEGQAGPNRRLAGRILAAAGGQDLAEDHFVDLRRLHAGALQHRADQVRPEFMGRKGGKAALETADGGAGGREDGDVAHVLNL